MKAPNLSWRLAIATRDQEGELVRAVLAGEEGAWEQLAEPHRGGVRALALRYVRNGDEAEDLTQEIFLRAYRKLAQFQGGSKFGTWLHAIAVRMCLSHLRLRKAEQVTLEDVAGTLVDQRPGSNTERMVLSRAEVAALVEAMKGLPAPQRVVLLLVAFGGLKEGEVAEELGLSLGTVKSRLHRARTAMRAQSGMTS